MNIINLSKDSSISYPVLDGYVTNENLSETLDSMTVIIPHVLDSNFEPYDLVMVGYYGWLVADVTKEMISVSVDDENNKTIYYNITLDLMSFTKFLETIQLPNLSITNIGQNRSIAYYALQYWGRYVSPALRKSYSSSNYTISDISRIYNKLNSVVCPEYTFQSPTAREVFDALFSKLGCIIKLEFKYNPLYETNQYVLYIDMLNLTSSSKPINEDYLTSLVKVQSAEDYVTALSHSIEDVIGQDSVTEYQKVKSEDYLMDTNNAAVILNQKIYDIDKFEVKHPSVFSAYYRYTIRGTVIALSLLATINFSNTDEQGITYDATFNQDDGKVDSLYIHMPSSTYFDVTSRLVVPDVYNSLETERAGYYKNTAADGWNTRLTKNSTLVFERGTKKIDGLFNYYSKQAIIGENVDLLAISIVLTMGVKEYMSNNPAFSFSIENPYTHIVYDFTTTGPAAEDLDWDSAKDLIYKITYKPYMNARFEIEDGEKNSHHVVMQDNSTNASTDIGQYLAQSVEKNMKLGNPTLIATARVPSNITTLYKLGEYYQDGTDRYILSNVESQHKANETLYKFTLTKNFTNRNLNTIINREKRYYALATDEIVERSEIAKKSYINISLAENESSIDSDNNHNIFYEYFAPTNPNGYNMLDFATYGVNGGAKIVGGTIPLNTIIGGNSVIYSASFMDNINYKLSNAGEVTGGYAMQYYKYTDDNGEFGSINCNIVNVTNETNLINQAEVGHPSLEVNFLKDQREKLTINFEYIYKSTDTRLKIGSHFAEAVVKKTNITINTYLYYTDGTYSHIHTSNTGIPDRWYISDADWYKNNNQDHVQVIVQTTATGEDVLIIYNPPRGIYLSAIQVDETY